MLDVTAGHPAPITTPIETAQRFSGAVTALKQSMIDWGSPSLEGDHEAVSIEPCVCN
jgi:hypothetical protein